MEIKWYHSKEIIEFFKVTPQTLNNWRRNGTIVYKKLNKRLFLYQMPESKIIKENGKTI